MKRYARMKGNARMKKLIRMNARTLAIGKGCLLLLLLACQLVCSGCTGVRTGVADAVGHTPQPGVACVSAAGTASNSPNAVVADAGVKMNEAEDPVEVWFRGQDARTLDTLDTVADADSLYLAAEGDTLLLASIPDEKVYLYGCAGADAVILRMDDRCQLFRWTYASPRLIPPQIGYADYDRDGIKEAAISLHTGTGTGVSVEQLYLVEILENGTCSAVAYAPDQYLGQLAEHITATLDQEEDRLLLAVDGRNMGEGIDLSAWLREGARYERIWFGSQIAFDVAGEGITLRTTPGCCFEGVASAQYEGMPDFAAEIVWHDGGFALSDVKMVDR